MLVKVLERHPDDQKAKSLLQQIDASPETLLGKENFPYRIRSEDTLSSLAERFLGDATLFYALARYNDLTLPATLQPGTTLRIPGRPKPVAKPTPRLPRPTPPAAAAPRPPSSPAVGKQRAVQLRAAGLEQLNRGDIDKAVKLLQQALQIDPTNAVIKRDLERAKRISRTVRARP